MDRKKRGYGDIKQWHWGMRSDLPSAVNVVTPGTVYITPWTMDTPMKIENWVDESNGGVRFKWSYTVDDPSDPFPGPPFLASWTLDFHFGVYKMLKGTGGSAGTLGLIWSTAGGWVGEGDSAGYPTPIIKYDYSNSPSIAAGTDTIITDGALYIAMLWVFNATAGGVTPAILSYGNTVSSGTWLYGTSGLTAQTSLPQTVAALGGTAKTFQEHWITQT